MVSYMEKEASDDSTYLPEKAAYRLTGTSRNTEKYGFRSLAYVEFMHTDDHAGNVAAETTPYPSKASACPISWTTSLSPPDSPVRRESCPFNRIYRPLSPLNLRRRAGPFALQFGA